MTSSVLDLSPQRRLLNIEDFSPVKILVGYEINSWFETKKKSPVPQKKKPPRYIHSRYNADKKLKQMTKSNQSPNKVNLFSIQRLKQQMDAISTKSQLKQLSTNCKTIEQKSTETKKKTNPIPVLNVNIRSFDQDLILQANEQKRPVKQVQHFFHLHQVQIRPSNKLSLGPMTQRMQQRKKRVDKILSCNKIRKNYQKQQIQNHITRKISLINKSQQIIKRNLSTNQKRTLNMIVSNQNNPSRMKLQNILVEQFIRNRYSSNYERH